MKRWLLYIILGVIGAFFVRTYLFEGIYIASSSMAPTLPVGRQVFANKFILHIRAPRRGDIIMFESPVETKKGLVKRVIAIPGDTVELRDKRVILNGEPENEFYVQYVSGGTVFEGDNLPPMAVPPEHVFVMGDNRDVSGDSRDWKLPNGERIPFLPYSLITGLVKGAE